MFIVWADPGWYKSVQLQQLHRTESFMGSVNLIIAGQSDPFLAQGGAQGSFFLPSSLAAGFQLSLHMAHTVHESAIIA